MTDEERLKADLSGAVDRGEIVVHYQPQIDLSTNQIVAAEALARWRHPDLGLISPAVFIPLAEETMLIHSIGRFMIEQVFSSVAQWRGSGIDIELSVNVSANQLTTLEFFELLNDDLNRNEHAKGSVTLEITESYPILESPAVAVRLDELRQRGLGISIDDYGIGYSTLQQLDRIPATELKIDQSLVQDESAKALALMTAVIELAHWRGARVVAEGVETTDQLELVRQLEVDRVQGFLLGRPMPHEDLEALLS